MKTIVYSILVYFILICAYKLFGDLKNHYWVNYYWLVSSLFYGILFLKLNKFTVIKKYQWVLKSIAGYWGVMAIFHTICFFNITLYARFAGSANKLTVGAVTIFIIFIVLTFKAFKYDKDYA